MCSSQSEKKTGELVRCIEMKLIPANTRNKLPKSEAVHTMSASKFGRGSSGSGSQGGGRQHIRRSDETV